MNQITIDLSDKVSHQIEESGVSHEQLNQIVGQLVEFYFNHYQSSLQRELAPVPQQLPRRSRKAGSGKHLNIVMADDFDDPLDDFVEYMS